MFNVLLYTGERTGTANLLLAMTGNDGRVNSVGWNNMKQQ